MEYKLRRKIDLFLTEWKQNPDRMPLIIKGARQVGKHHQLNTLHKITKTSLKSILLQNLNIQKFFHQAIQQILLSKKFLL